MEAIKVSVNVTVDLSENAKAFIAKLFTSSIQAPTPTPAATAPVAKPAPAPAATAPVAKPAPAPVAPVAPVAPAAKPAPAPESAASCVTIEQVRRALALKVNNNREVIKAKLNELGAPSVTKLDPAKYLDMLTFLNGLA